MEKKRKRTSIIDITVWVILSKRNRNNDMLEEIKMMKLMIV